MALAKMGVGIMTGSRPYDRGTVPTSTDTYIYIYSILQLQLGTAIAIGHFNFNWALQLQLEIAKEQCPIAHFIRPVSNYTLQVHNEPLNITRVNLLQVVVRKFINALTALYTCITQYKFQ